MTGALFYSSNNYRLKKRIAELEAKVNKTNAKKQKQLEEREEKAKALLQENINKAFYLTQLIQKTEANLAKQGLRGKLRNPLASPVRRKAKSSGFNGPGWPLANVFVRFAGTTKKIVLHVVAEKGKGVKADQVDIGKAVHNPKLKYPIKIVNIKLEDGWTIIDIETKEKIDTSPERFEIKLQLP